MHSLSPLLRRSCTATEESGRVCFCTLGRRFSSPRVSDCVVSPSGTAEEVQAAGQTVPGYVRGFVVELAPLHQLPIHAGFGAHSSWNSSIFFTQGSPEMRCRLETRFLWFSFTVTYVPRLVSSSMMMFSTPSVGICWNRCETWRTVCQAHERVWRGWSSVSQHDDRSIRFFHVGTNVDQLICCQRVCVSVSAPRDWRSVVRRNVSEGPEESNSHPTSLSGTSHSSRSVKKNSTTRGSRLSPSWSHENFACTSPQLYSEYRTVEDEMSRKGKVLSQQMREFSIQAEEALDVQKTRCCSRSRARAQ